MQMSHLLSVYKQCGVIVVVYRGPCYLLNGACVRATGPVSADGEQETEICPKSCSSGEESLIHVPETLFPFAISAVCFRFVEKVRKDDGQYYKLYYLLVL